MPRVTLDLPPLRVDSADRFTRFIQVHDPLHARTGPCGVVRRCSAAQGECLDIREVDGWSLSVWSRNLLDNDYFELLSPAPGGPGLYVGLPGDPPTVGVTLRMAPRSRP